MIHHASAALTDQRLQQAYEQRASRTVSPRGWAISSLD
jgi:hypothetical protein